MSTSILNKMCDIVKNTIYTEKGFKEIHLNACAKALFEHCDAKVSRTQVYNHLRKWRVHWIHISKLRDLSRNGMTRLSPFPYPKSTAKGMCRLAHCPYDPT
jgi:hypothetical protein